MLIILIYCSAPMRNAPVHINRHFLFYRHKNYSKFTYLGEELYSVGYSCSPFIGNMLSYFLDGLHGEQAISTA